jgi:hypothetical protein
VSDYRLSAGFEQKAGTCARQSKNLNYLVMKQIILFFARLEHAAYGATDQHGDA